MVIPQSSKLKPGVRFPYTATLLLSELSPPPLFFLRNVQLPILYGLMDNIRGFVKFFLYLMPSGIDRKSPMVPSLRTQLCMHLRRCSLCVSACKAACGGTAPVPSFAVYPKRTGVHACETVWNLFLTALHSYRFARSEM